MLTDIFAIRYENTPLFTHYSNREKRIFHQSFTILEEFHPYWKETDSQMKLSETFWQELHKKVSNELGVRWLSDPYYKIHVGIGEYRREETHKRPEIEICRNWITRGPTDSIDIDAFVKNRLSLVEVGLRSILEKVQKSEEFLHTNQSMISQTKKKFETGRAKYEAAASELNIRFRSARFPLNYHNGFIQIETDELISKEIEQPFWSLVSEPLWENVDIDMKEALDLRDGGGKDPALYSARALESALKIISDELDVTHGSEKGAHGFIDNISKKQCQFISPWEAEFLKLYFTRVRNPLGHGPGKEPMPTLKADQTSWAIEQAMSWIKLLASRLAIKKDITT
ncbi:AbiJ-NTD4 domain-containing protein [Marivita sp.]|uniref:AbiJ-NTD4 domain-containing protein n=1 Tax=Marivita sp. TaxID=2003365 RepID=UPI003A8C53E3